MALCKRFFFLTFHVAVEIWDGLNFWGVLFLFEIKIAQILRKYGKWLQV